MKGAAFLLLAIALVIVASGQAHPRAEPDLRKEIQELRTRIAELEQRIEELETHQFALVIGKDGFIRDRCGREIGIWGVDDVHSEAERIR